MADDAVSLSLITAAFSDKQTGERLAELLKKLNEVQEAQKALADAQAHADATLEEAKQLHTEAVALKGEADRMKADFEAKNQGLADAITEHNAQRDAWGGERSAIEQANRDRTAALDKRAAELKAAADDLATREKALADGTAAQKAIADDLQRREAELQGIVAKLTPAPKAA